MCVCVCVVVVEKMKDTKALIKGGDTPGIIIRKYFDAPNK